MKRIFAKKGTIELVVKKSGHSVEVYHNGQWIADMWKDSVWKTVSFGEYAPPFHRAIWCDQEYPVELYRMQADNYWQKWEEFSEEEKQEASSSWEREQVFYGILPKIKEMIFKREGKEILPDWVRELIPKESFSWLSYK